MVEFLVAHGADVDARGAVRDWQRKVIREPRPKDMNQGGFTPLLYAAREGCIDCAHELVAGGADINLPDPDRVTPLVMALLNLHFDLAAYLIEAGADVDKWDLYGRTPLYMAADTNTLPVMGNGAMVVLPSMDKLTGARRRQAAARQGREPEHPAEAPAAVSQRAAGPRRRLRSCRSARRRCCAPRAPATRRWRKLLLEHGALVDLPSNQGVTPLMAAAGLEYGLRVTRGRNRTEEGVLETLQLLVDAGADVNARELTEPRGDAASGQLVINQRLSDYSYDYRGRQVPSPRAIPHRTALHGAAMKGFDPIVKFLVDARRGSVREGRERPHRARSRERRLQRAVPAPGRRAARRDRRAAEASSWRSIRRSRRETSQRAGASCAPAAQREGRSTSR